MKEFEIIKKYFLQSSLASSQIGLKSVIDSEVKLGIGDDCAVLNIKEDADLLITTDTMVSGVHFYPDAPADSLGHKILAVNLSDIAAMGGIPKWALLNLTLPTDSVYYKNERWLSEFTNGFTRLANKYNLKLIGGDTTSIKGNELILTVTVIGLKSNNILTRSNAQVNDGIFITGEVGEPGVILSALQEKKNVPTQNKLYYPEPRVATGIFISSYANSAIDLSDGLLADLSHILQQSNKTGKLYIDSIPRYAQANLNDILVTGDEYEIIFTAPMMYKDILESYSGNKISNIGIIQETGNESKNNDIIFIAKDGNIINRADLDISVNNGWEHF